MLAGNGFILRPLKATDAPLIMGWENENLSHNGGIRLTRYELPEIQDYIEQIKDVYLDEQLRLVIEKSEDSQAIGTVDLFEVDFKNSSASIGVLIASIDERRKGFASKALNELALYSFEVLKLSTLKASVKADNLPSQKLFNKCGFKLDSAIDKTMTYIKTNS